MAVGGAFDPSVATPDAAAAGRYFQTLEGTQIEGARATTDAATTTNRQAYQYNNVLKPQLQGSLGASGNWASGAGQKAMGLQEMEYTNSQSDVQLALSRHLNDLERQRNWASVGLIV